MLFTPEQEEAFFQIALKEASLAPSHGDIPVGAVVVSADGKILSQSHNQREINKDPVGHAEVIALQMAAKNHGHWNLTGCRLYVTLEPCPLCMSAAMLSRISEVVYLAKDEKGGAISLDFHLHDHPKLNHRYAIRRGDNATQQITASTLLKDFFRQMREK
jgi:tRNA(adenine34) deaminase